MGRVKIFDGVRRVVTRPSSRVQSRVFRLPKTSSGARYRYPPVGYPLRLVNDGHTVGVTFPETYKGGIGLSSKATVHEMFQDANFFRVYKLQIHSPAEHLYNGERHPFPECCLSLILIRLVGRNCDRFSYRLFFLKPG